MSIVHLPKLADSTDEYLVVSIEVAVGDPVTHGDVLLEVESDKAQVEVICDVEGTVSAVFVAEEDEVRTGDPIVEVTLTPAW
jgi:pyruvate/2-oxoglutarate dehydrogenase complex dihydrolipoamide acyltransferase (E2) component